MLNWEAVSSNFGEAVGTQSERAGVALFRMGELMSIEARLEEEYGVGPEVTYDRGDAGRVLGLLFSDYALPAGATGEEHARGIAAFAIGQTKKAGEVDLVRVSFASGGGDPVVYDFRAGELN